MGVLMFIVDVTLEGINTLKFGTVKRLIASTGGFWVPYIVLLCFNMGFAAVSGYIVAYEAPFAAGSGIPELKSYLNGIHLRGEAPSSSSGPARTLSWEASVHSGPQQECPASTTSSNKAEQAWHGPSFAGRFASIFMVLPACMSWQELPNSAAKLTDPLTAGHERNYDQA